MRGGEKRREEAGKEGGGRVAISVNYHPSPHQHITPSSQKNHRIQDLIISYHIVRAEAKWGTVQ